MKDKEQENSMLLSRISALYSELERTRVQFHKVDPDTCHTPNQHSIGDNVEFQQLVQQCDMHIGDHSYSSASRL